MIVKNRIKKHSEFQDIIEKGRNIKSEFISIYYINNNLGYSRIGISVSKKNGNAVIRNKIKRQLRAIFSQIIDFSKPVDYIFIVRKGFDVDKFNEIKQKIESLLSNI